MLKKLTLVLSCVALLSACGSTKTTTNQPTPVAQTGGVFEMTEKDKPEITLNPTSDGHWINLKINKVPALVSAIEYEMTYNAIDNKNEIEKGVSGTIKSQEISSTVERKLLLGTESCTAGCKYKYDEGVVGGHLSINFINQKGQTATYESDFALKKSGKEYTAVLDTKF